MKKLATLICFLCLASCAAVPASALEYTIEAPAGPAYAKATSVEVVVTADRGEQANEDLSKNAALIPPTFGSPTSYLAGSGLPLTPNLVTGGSGVTGIYFADAVSSTPVVPGGGAVVVTSVPQPVSYTRFTEVTSDLYYSGGHLGRLSIPTLGVNVKVVQGTDSAALAKGAGHFENTSIWDGNVAIAGHNRGVNCYFGNIHTLVLGDTITYTTKLGTRTYAVTSVEKVSETDNSMLGGSGENMLTLITCVRDQKPYRWCVRAVEIG